MTTGSLLTWQRLRDLKPSEFEDAGDGWHEVSARAEADRDAVDRAMTAKLRETQESESARAAIARLRRLSRNYQYVHTEAALIRTTLNGLSAELTRAQGELTEALEDAASLGFTVQPDGAVNYPPAEADTYLGGGLGAGRAPGGGARGNATQALQLPGLTDEYTAPLRTDAPAPNPNAAKAQAIADRIARAVRSATEIDDRYTRALNNLKAAKGLDVTEATLSDTTRDTATVRETAERYLERGIPSERSPQAIHAWWTSLTEEQRNDYMEVAPDLIGNLDGIPSLSRDEANRHYLPLLIDQLEKQGGEDARAKLEGLRGIEKRLNEPSRVPMFLLGIGTEGNGRAIVAFGNPDTSRNVSAYVPGLGTKLDGEFAEGTLQRGQDTALYARKYDKSSAAIVWLGYDAPQSADVMGEGDAKRGAPAYNSFMDGLVATNDHRDPHLTAIGHSYGSFTVGTAAQRDSGIPGADDIILLGSPGVGADRAEALGVGRSHVFVGAAENDPVTRLPSGQQSVAGGAGYLLAGPLGAVVAGDLADQHDDDLWFGKDPASEAFGARRFRVGDGPHPVTELGLFEAHSQYFTPGKDLVSTNNISKIVAGKSDEIVEEVRR
ncbi:alpha/beta hydrolase [Streptomyces sp. NPDC088261]|uniref:alpha/beta hydrolase n=1 Tax=Streptomyces sp. NPDC088261 TaxID=3365851 RepID=UPI0038278012